MSDVRSGSRASSAESNPYLATPGPSTPTAAEAGVQELATAECWRLLEASTLGRLAVDGADGRPDVFPVNFLAHEGSLILRSAPGSKLRSITEHPAVAFEVDGADAAFYWSVVVRGVAHRMNLDADIEASGILELVSASPTAKHNFIRVTPATVTGRRFPSSRTLPFRSRPATSSEQRNAQSAPTTKPADPPHDDKPQPIPHFPPAPGAINHA